ncbi:MAG: nucleotidyl transferase [Bacteroidetes bacterium]|nr:MAG: nucleotidyl transferase [Bacteroidota bacterium]
MNITKAVITAAGRGPRLYPVGDTVQKAMLPMVDLDGTTRPAIQIIAQEAFSCGIEEVCMVCAPGDEARYRSAFETRLKHLRSVFPAISWAEEEAARIQSLLKRLHFRVQAEPKGYGHAVSCARDFVGNAHFLLLLGDYVYLSDHPERGCAQQVVDLANQQGCAVSAVNPTIEHLITNYGTLTGRHLPNMPGVYQVEKLIEKPSLSLAELELQTPGLRLGYYLCFFGIHVLTPLVFELLEEQAASLEKGQSQLLTPALQMLADRDSYLALEVKGSRYDLGKKYGWMRAQLALGLAGQDQQQVLTAMVEMLAEANRRKGGLHT